MIYLHYIAILYNSPLPLSLLFSLSLSLSFSLSLVLSLCVCVSPLSPQVVTVNLTGISFNASSLLFSQPTISDLDLDGHPDIITPVLSHTTKSKLDQLHPLVLLGSAGGQLRPQWDLFNEAAVTNVTQATFFDLWEDVSG